MNIGLVELDGGGDVGLAAAAHRHPGLALQSVSPTARIPGEIDALIIDAPLIDRTKLVNRFADIPILTEAPVPIRGNDLDRVVSVNPLRYGLHTRRLIEQVRQTDPGLETIFAAWRFRPGTGSDSRLSHLVDFLRALHPVEIAGVTALERRNPLVLLATVRYSTGAIASLELGDHLPPGFPCASELLVECFSTERAYHCTPGNQSVSSYGARPTWVDWQPDAADSILTAFVAWLTGAPRPAGSTADDVIALEVSERIRQAAE